MPINEPKAPPPGPDPEPERPHPPGPDPDEPSPPDAMAMEQMAGNATLEELGCLHPCRYLLHDRDTKFCESFGI